MYLTSFLLFDVALASTVVLVVLVRLWFRKVHNFAGKHVVITGGSDGIGKALAKRFLEDGAKVTIMARTLSKLEAARDELVKTTGNEACEVVSVDVSDMEQVIKAMDTAEGSLGTPAVLIMSAGRAHPGYFLEQDVSIFEDTMKLNYFGALHCTKATVPKMIERGDGHLVFISSAASGANFLGYLSYAPTKAALKSLSDGLRNELRGFGVKVHVAYPPDTDTPGYETENRTKPKENLQIQPPELYNADVVAETMFDGLCRGEYHLPSPDIVQNFLMASHLGIQPRGRWGVFEVLFQPIVAIACLLYGFNADRIASTYGKTAQLKSKKQD